MDGGESLCYNGGMNTGFYLFLAFLAGFIIAQGWKLIVGLVKKGKKFTAADFRYYAFKSGGMPSGHTASFTALSTAILLFFGINHPATALAFCTTIIFVYDAVNVRYAVGEHGRLLNEIATSDNSPKTKPQKIVEGHTIPQVTVGAILGAVVGICVFLIAGGNLATAF